ncbi:MAG TPA: AMP-binding protein, partial [Alphaproteobacteria bacterium]|nr:AMP-binding protein [Alphaproteobacteria bacterium]
MLTPSGLADSFARDNLPPPAAWPDLINLEALGYPERLNCAAELLLRPVREGRGGRPCLVTDDEAWTYADLARRAAQIAGVLSRELGLVPGNRVLLHAPNTPMAVAAWFGCVLAGGIVVATMPLLRGREIATVAEKAAVEFALFDARLGDAVRDAAAQAPRLRHLVAFGPGGDLEGRMAAQPAEFAPVDTAADDICLIAFTSGTTGQPKGTLHFHRDVLAICDGFSRHILQPEADDVFIGSPPLAFTFGLGGLVLFPLRVGASAVLIEKPSPDALLAGIARHRATILFTAPTAYRAMLDRLAQYDTSSLRKGVSAGETLPPATWHAFAERTGIRLIDGIGATEMLHIFISASGDAIRPGATGRPVPGYEARVVDAEGRPLPPGTVGWLAVRGPTGCRYLADDRQGQYVRGGWNVTGDAYLMDADGYFHFQARNDDMIVSAGYNIAGPEVEAALVEHEAVAECAVVASPDAERGHVVKAFVVLRPGFAADEAMVRELQDHVKATIAPYKYPR